MAKVKTQGKPAQPPAKRAGRVQAFVTAGLDGKLVYLSGESVLALVDELGEDLKYSVGGKPMSANEIIKELQKERMDVAMYREQLQVMIDANEAEIDMGIPEGIFKK